MMNTRKENEFTVQGADPPVPVGVAGERAGPAQPSASDCSVLSVGNQAEGGIMATGKGNGGGGGNGNMEGEQAFSRSRKIARTPPPAKQKMSSNSDRAESRKKSEQTPHGGEELMTKPGTSSTQVQKEHEANIITLDSSGSLDGETPKAEAKTTETRGGEKKLPDNLLKHSRLNIFSQLKRCNSVEVKKRKILDTSIGEDYGSESHKNEDQVATNLLETIEKVVKCTKELDIKIIENTNTKREIKEISARLKRCAETLASDEIRKWFSEQKWKQAPSPSQDAISRVEGITQHRNSIGTQTDALQERDGTSSVEEIRSKLGEDISLEAFKNLLDRRWPAATFTKCEREGAASGKMENGNDIVICRINEDWNHPIVKNFRTKNPEIDEAVRAKDKADTLLGVKRSSEMIGDQDPDTAREDRVSFLVRIGGNDKDKDDETLFQAFKKIRSVVSGSKEVNLYCKTTLTRDERIRKHLEHAFTGHIGRVVLGTTKSKTKQLAPEQAKIGVKKKTSDSTSLAMVVESKGTERGFKEVLSQVKLAIGCCDTRNVVKTFRSTRDGKVLIVMDKNEDAYKKMHESLAQAGNLDTKRAGDNKTEMIHVRGMDALTTKDDIVVALEEKLGTLKNKFFKIGELRPNIRDTLAVTIVLNGEDAEIIDREQFLRVGMVRCKAERRIKVQRC